MDVQMPGLSTAWACSAAREAIHDLPHIVFVTAYDQYAIEAFRLEAMDYLLEAGG
jgi:DNA-binding LytR/AlgR family response regulator